MRTVLLSLLAAALCLHAVHSLQCYTCIAAEKNSDCLTKTECESNENYCMTVVASVSGSTGIVKQCVRDCTPAESSQGNTKASVSCCREDLCNKSGAASAKLSSLALLVPAGLVLSLLRAGL
ncbi:lymphocyte antigen 6E-like [Rhinatrema bivittatum]|uniref:lymphocyte antigen 6E-like n=1 Tax=Rhinatrema bivittatum TaxID=194408 RepID=UPI00112AD5C8|nr:lymphocyte antigen 6E-like [Rhinatrema bivittatum]